MNVSDFDNLIFIYTLGRQYVVKTDFGKRDQVNVGGLDNAMAGSLVSRNAFNMFILF